jgi:hypothetical protein
VPVYRDELWARIHADRDVAANCQSRVGK